MTPGEHPAAPYERLLALAEREATLIGAGAWDDLPALAAERTALVAALPAAAPLQARGALERLAGLQAIATAALSSGRADTARELSGLRRGRGAVRGYGASASGQAVSAAHLDGSA